MFRDIEMTINKYAWVQDESPVALFLAPLSIIETLGKAPFCLSSQHMGNARRTKFNRDLS